MEKVNMKCWNRIYVYFGIFLVLVQVKGVHQAYMDLTSCIGNKCIYMYRHSDGRPFKYAWERARGKCTEQGMSMVTLKDPQEIEALQRVIDEALNEEEHGCWLGARQEVLRQPTWLRGGGNVTLDIDDSDIEDNMEGCVAYSTHYDEPWLEYHRCYEEYMYICQSLLNEDEYTVHNDTTLSWHKARVACHNKGEVLASVPDEMYDGEDMGLRRDIRKPYYWVGAKTSSYRWISDGSEVLLTNFDRAQPSNIDENCLTITNEGTWGDVTCTSARIVLCEIVDDTTGSTDTPAATTEPPEVSYTASPAGTGTHSPASSEVTTQPGDYKGQMSTSQKPYIAQSEEEDDELTMIYIIIAIIGGLILLALIILIIVLLVKRKKQKRAEKRDPYNDVIHAYDNKYDQQSIGGVPNEAYTVGYEKRASVAGGGGGSFNELAERESVYIPGSTLNSPAHTTTPDTQTTPPRSSGQFYYM